LPPGSSSLRALVAHSAAILLCSGLLLAQAKPPAPAPANPISSSYRPSDPLNASAFDHFYNQEYDRAIAEFQQVEQRHPGIFSPLITC